MGVPSPAQLGIIAVICIVVFGGKRVTELMSNAGKSIVDFKQATKEVPEQTHDQS